jgi:3-phosphoshikimate 1-carboxyvinyltransferase
MTPLPDVLPIKPFTKPVRGEVALPGSKSITNRALLLAALCDRAVTLTGALFSEDTEIMAKALRQLGIPVEENEAEKTILVKGQAGKIPAEHAELFVGNAGTAARFLTALCAAAPRGTYKIDGVPQMRKRPMKGLFDALRKLGAEIRCPVQDGFFPIAIRAHGLDFTKSAHIDPSESSQLLSALLMVTPPFALNPVAIELTEQVRESFVQMTIQVMKRFGAVVLRSGNIFDVRPSPYRLLNPTTDELTDIYPIEPDASAASYFLALPMATHGRLMLSNFRETGGLQGDRRFIDVVREIGSRIEENSNGVSSEFARDGKIKGIHKNFSEFSDTFLTLAAIAPLLEGPTKITGIAHTRKQETDRVAGMARELKKLGQDVIETGDSLEIAPNLDELRKRAGQGPIEIETYHDHRFAMSFAILGCHDLLKNGRPWLSIKNPACCAKTFPNFFDVLEQAWRNSHQK